MCKNRKCSLIYRDSKRISDSTEMGVEVGRVGEGDYKATLGMIDIFIILMWYWFIGVYICKNLLIIHFNCVQFILHQLYLFKAVLKHYYSLFQRSLDYQNYDWIFTVLVYTEV